MYYSRHMMRLQALETKQFQMRYRINILKSVPVMTNQEKCKDDFYSNADQRRLFFLRWHRFVVDGSVHLYHRLLKI